MTDERKDIAAMSLADMQAEIAQLRAYVDGADAFAAGIVQVCATMAQALEEVLDKLADQPEAAQAFIAAFAPVAGQIDAAVVTLRERLGEKVLN